LFCNCELNCPGGGGIDGTTEHADDWIDIDGFLSSPEMDPAAAVDTEELANGSKDFSSECKFNRSAV
jgi:hypothetical protein